MEPKPRYDQAVEYEQRGKFAKAFHGAGSDLEHPRCAPDAQTFGRAGYDAYDTIDGHALAMQQGAWVSRKLPAQAVQWNWRHGPPLGCPLARRFPSPTQPR